MSGGRESGAVGNRATEMTGPTRLRSPEGFGSPRPPGLSATHSYPRPSRHALPRHRCTGAGRQWSSPSPVVSAGVTQESNRGEVVDDVGYRPTRAHRVTRVRHGCDDVRKKSRHWVHSSDGPRGVRVSGVLTPRPVSVVTPRENSRRLPTRAVWVVGARDTPSPSVYGVGAVRGREQGRGNKVVRGKGSGAG